MNRGSMSEIVEIVDVVIQKLKNLFEKINKLEFDNTLLQQTITDNQRKIEAQSATIEGLENDLKTLKIANSLLGSNENKRDTRLKINSLIREIDYCIAQLSD